MRLSEGDSKQSFCVGWRLLGLNGALKNTSCGRLGEGAGELIFYTFSAKVLHLGGLIVKAFVALLALVIFGWMSGTTANTQEPCQVWVWTGQWTLSGNMSVTTNKMLHWVKLVRLSYKEPASIFICCISFASLRHLVFWEEHSMNLIQGHGMVLESGRHNSSNIYFVVNFWKRKL